MVFDKPINGKTIILSAVTIADSEFILRLRTDKIIGKFLNPTEKDVQSQEIWIRNQRSRMNDYYFLISDCNSTPIGTISLYNIINFQGEFGRWICPGNSVQALESAMLLHDFGFDVLGLNSIFSLTNTLNRPAINFNKSFGANYTGETVKYNMSGIIVERAIIYSTHYPTIRRKISALIDKVI